MPSTTVGRTYFSIQNLTKVSTSTFEPTLFPFPIKSTKGIVDSRNEPETTSFLFTKLRHSIRWLNDTRIRSRTNISSLRSSSRYIKFSSVSFASGPLSPIQQRRPVANCTCQSRRIFVVSFSRISTGYRLSAAEQP